MRKSHNVGIRRPRGKYRLGIEARIQFFHIHIIVWQLNL